LICYWLKSWYVNAKWHIQIEKIHKSNLHGILLPIVKSKLRHNSPKYPTYNLAYFLSIIQFCWCIKQAFNICSIFSIIFEVRSIILIIILCLCGMMQLMSPSCKKSLVTLKNHWFFLSHHDGSLIGCFSVTCLSHIFIYFNWFFLIQCIGESVIIAFFMLIVDNCICDLFRLAYQGKDIVFRFIIE
jgi:hypothetical protein